MSAPRYLREMLVFPYLRGQEFCAALFDHGGYAAVSKAYARFFDNEAHRTCKSCGHMMPRP